MEIICFHNPEEENGYLSNWYLSDFSIDGIKFSSMEQYMMYSKAVCFEDLATAGKILKTDEYYAFYDVLEDHIDVTENTCRSERECYDMAERLSGYQLPLNFWLPVHIKTAIPAQQACEYTMFRICNPAEFKDLCGDRNIFKPVDNMEKSKTASQQAIRALFENPLKNAYVFFDQF